MGGSLGAVSDFGNVAEMDVTFRMTTLWLDDTAKNHPKEALKRITDMVFYSSMSATT